MLIPNTNESKAFLENLKTKIHIFHIYLDKTSLTLNSTKSSIDAEIGVPGGGVLGCVGPGTDVVKVRVVRPRTQPHVRQHGRYLIQREKHHHHRRERQT